MSPAADDASGARGRRDELGPPADAPCRSCPYRRDVPSGVWEFGEYLKLIGYDRDTGEQPRGLFQCHITDEASHPTTRRSPSKRTDARICAGWAGCHDGDKLASLRLALYAGRISPDTAHRVRTYVSPVPLWETGAAAAVHGVASLLDPGEDARQVIDTLVRVYGKTFSPPTATALAASAAACQRGETSALARGDSMPTDETLRRAVKAIHAFFVDHAGFDGGQAMIDDAAELVDRLADAGVLARHASGPAPQDVTGLIRNAIVEHAGEDLGPLTTDLAEEFRASLAAAGLLGDGVFAPLPLHHDGSPRRS